MILIGFSGLVARTWGAFGWVRGVSATVLIAVGFSVQGYGTRGVIASVMILAGLVLVFEVIYREAILPRPATVLLVAVRSHHLHVDAHRCREAVVAVLPRVRDALRDLDLAAVHALVRAPRACRTGRIALTMARAGRWLAVATSITLAAAGAATPSGASMRADEIVEDRQLDRALRRGLEEAGTPGIAASVVFADGRQWTGFAGQADTADRRRVTATTPFAVASVTKTFVAALVLQLAEEGTVDLDEPIVRRLPDVPGNDVITLRQLLNHTSGLSNGPIGAPSQRWTPDEVLASMGPPDCAPGTCFRYADMNYVAAGAVLEAATTSSLPRLVRRRFLVPLGMTHTWFQSFERARGTVATAYRMGVPLSDGSSTVPTTDFVTRTGYSGALATTARDLAIWGDALLGGKVLRRASLAEMLDFDATSDLPCPLADQCLGGYGLGMAFDQLHASPIWQHSGSTGALLTHLPRQGITITVLTNSAPGEPPGPFPAEAELADALPSLQRHPGIHSVDIDGADRHLVTSTGAGVGASAAAVSPDGAHLAFVRERGDDGGDIAIAGIDGQDARLITHDRASNFRPAWSPDGEHLAFRE